MKKLWALTLLHPAVDACSMAVFVRCGAALPHAIVYNALAFGLQLPLGLLMDCSGECRRRFFLIGIACLMAGSGLIAFDGFEWLSLGFACVGNALFHLTGGMDVLDDSEGKAGPVALFVSTGALGLMLGKVVSPRYPFLFWIALMSVLGGLSAHAIRCGLGKVEPLKGNFCARPSLPVLQMGSLLALAAIVAWRSWAGLVASSRTSGGSLSFAVLVASVVLIGKALGGWAGDRLGNLAVVALSLLSGAILALFGDPARMGQWIVLLFVSQLATGPVLAWLYREGDGRSGLAFGLNCFALFVGFVFFV